MNVNVCNDFHASRGTPIHFINPSVQPCTIGSPTSLWPFTNGPSIQVGPGATFDTSIANVPDGTYHYDVSCCSQKSVTIP